MTDLTARDTPGDRQLDLRRVHTAANYPRYCPERT
jgi:hypothetical protein